MAKFHAKVVFGLGFDIERDPSTPSGFKASERQLGTHSLHLYSDLRLKGFAELLKKGFADELNIVSGYAGRYPDEELSQATAIRDILIKEHGVSPLNRVGAITSNATTGGNIHMIQSLVVVEGLKPHECAVMTNHYHLPRVMYDMASVDVWMTPLSAEAVWLAGSSSKEEFAERKNTLLDIFNDQSDLGRRVVAEITGMAQKLTGDYVVRTSNADPVPKV